MNKILIVAAHPDDELLGCGGLIAKYHQTKKIKVIFLAEGSSCRFSSLEIQSELSKKNIANRTACAKAALQIFGVNDLVFYDYPCGRLDTIPILDINKAIEFEISKFQPDTVLTHSEDDVNNDHRLVSRSVMMATRPNGTHNINNLLSFEIQSSTEWNLKKPFAPNHFEVLSEQQLGMKWEALKFYDSEIRSYPHPRSREGMEALARYRGMQVGAEFAEAFQIMKKVIL
jgi:LmbE family N-acetylglucosaminyl deacetylase